MRLAEAAQGPARAGARRAAGGGRREAGAHTALSPAARVPAVGHGRAVLGRRRGLRDRAPRDPALRPRRTARRRRFAALADRALSEPLDRTRPLWRVYLVPKLADGTAGMVAKFHHALVDGKSAVEVALLLFDVTPDAEPAPAPEWRPEPEPGTARLAMGALAGSASESLRAARGLARMAGTPRSSGVRLYDSVRRAALTVGDDLLRPAPASYLNVPIGPRRTLVRHRAPLAKVLAIKRAAGVTVNDVCLAVVAGALRETALARGDTPQPLKAMVPVSVRAEGEEADAGQPHLAGLRGPAGEPLDAARPPGGGPQGDHGVQGVGPARPGPRRSSARWGCCPTPCARRAARMVGSARVYNLTVSNIPGPRFPALRARLGADRGLPRGAAGGEARAVDRHLRLPRPSPLRPLRRSGGDARRDEHPRRAERVAAAPLARYAAGLRRSTNSAQPSPARSSSS